MMINDLSVYYWYNYIWENIECVLSSWTYECVITYVLVYTGDCLIYEWGIGSTSSVL